MVCKRYYGLYTVLYPKNRTVFVTVQIRFVQCRVLLKLTSLSWEYILPDRYSVLQLLLFCLRIQKMPKFNFSSAS